MSGPLPKAELVKKTKNEIESSFRIFVKEWLHEGRCPSEEAARAELQARFGGRVRPEDMQVMKDWDDTWILLTKRWNLSAEVKGEILAAEFLEALVHLGYEAQMVARNSKAEHSLAAYGVTLIPRTST